MFFVHAIANKSSNFLLRCTFVEQKRNALTGSHFAFFVFFVDALLPTTLHHFF
jgi:hypothetical protein